MFVSRYDPLKLSAPLHELSQSYAQRQPKFDSTNLITTRKHVSRVVVFMDLEEVDYEDVKLRSFSQILMGEFRTWYKSLVARSISSFKQLEHVFLRRWEVKVNPFHIMEKYKNLKRQSDKSIQEFSTHFNRVYNSILADIKPPPCLAMLHFLNGFEAEISYQLRERNLTTLEDMRKVVVDVEANLMIKRVSIRAKRKEGIKE